MPTYYIIHQVILLICMRLKINNKKNHLNPPCVLRMCYITTDWTTYISKVSKAAHALFYFNVHEIQIKPQFVILNFLKNWALLVCNFMVESMENSLVWYVMIIIIWLWLQIAAYILREEGNKLNTIISSWQSSVSWVDRIWLLYCFKKFYYRIPQT